MSEPLRYYLGELSTSSAMFLLMDRIANLESAGCSAVVMPATMFCLASLCPMLPVLNHVEYVRSCDSVSPDVDR